MTEPREPEWNWVQARAECSAVTMFERVRTGAIANTTARNAIRQFDRPGNRFKVDPHGEGRGFTVFDTWGTVRRAVDVTLEHDVLHILVDLPAGQNTTIDAAITLNDEGVCKFKVGTRELDPWQLLKMALEPLFFQD